MYFIEHNSPNIYYVVCYTRSSNNNCLCTPTDHDSFKVHDCGCYFQIDVIFYNDLVIVSEQSVISVQSIKNRFNTPPFFMRFLFQSGEIILGLGYLYFKLPVLAYSVITSVQINLLYGYLINGVTLVYYLWYVFGIVNCFNNALRSYGDARLLICYNGCLTSKLMLLVFFAFNVTLYIGLV